MPAGVTWGPYLRFGVAGMLSMFAGSQLVHSIFQPLADFDQVVQKEREKFEAEKIELERRVKAAEESVKSSDEKSTR